MDPINQIFKELRLDASCIQPVGNHELKRHLVYKFKENNQSRIIKIYYKELRLENEVYVYQHAKVWGIPTAEMIAYGTLSDGRDYIILTELPGEVMANIKLCRETEVQLYNKIGMYLSKMHRIEMNLNQNKLYEPSLHKIEKYMLDIAKLPLGHEAHELLNKAYVEYKHLLMTTDFNNMPYGFCHNDFDSRNVLVEDGQITGIIDFEISGYGSIEMDLINLQRKIFSKDKVLEEAFFKGYSEYSKLDMTAYATRMQVNLLADVIENCSWAFDQASAYFDENIAFLKTILD